MTTLVLRYSKWHVKRRGQSWAKVASGILLAAWIVVAFGLTPLLDPLSFILLSFLLLGGSVVLSFGPGMSRVSPVRAVIETREVDGGVLMTVMDDRNRRAEVVVDAARAREVTESLAARR